MNFWWVYIGMSTQHGRIQINPWNSADTHVDGETQTKLALLKRSWKKKQHDSGGMATGKWFDDIVIFKCWLTTDH